MPVTAYLLQRSVLAEPRDVLVLARALLAKPCMVSTRDALDVSFGQDTVGAVGHLPCISCVDEEDLPAPVGTLT